MSDKDKEETTQPLEEGGQIIYALEDSGRDYPSMGLLLSPNEPLTIGKDLDLEFAHRLVDEGICRPHVPKRKPKVEPPAAPTVDTPIAPQEPAKLIS